jgi:hypothetical protein
MRKPLLKAFSVIAAVALAAACIILPNPGEDGGWRTIPERKTATGTGTEYRETFNFRTGGTLSLENDYGNVEISGWNRDSVEVVARPAAMESQPERSTRSSASRKSMPDVEIRETDDGLMIRTRTFEGPGNAPAVDYLVRVPDSVNLTGIRISEGNLSVADVFGKLEASLDQGDLAVENYSGSVDVTIGTGDADVEVLDLHEEDAITISSRRGNIVLRLESGAGAIVEADAPRGRVRSDFDLGAELPAPTVKGWIGEGGPNIILKATSGRIEIVSVKKSPGSAGAMKAK